MEHIISDGRHMLSGVGRGKVKVGWGKEVDADLNSPVEVELAIKK